MRVAKEELDDYHVLICKLALPVLEIKVNCPSCS